MRRRLNKKELWAIVLATGMVAASSACSAVDDNDKTKNPTMGTAGAGATPTGDAGVTGGGGTATGGTTGTTGASGP